MRMVFPSHTSTRMMDELATDVGTLVESFFGDITDRRRPAAGARMNVPMDVDESEDSYLVTMDVPGVSIESISIDVHEDTLTVAGCRGVAESDCKADETTSQDKVSESAAAEGEETSAPALKRLRRERGNGRFERKLELPVSVDVEAVSAELSDGVLVVRLPKADPEKGKRRIPISRA